MQTKNAGGIRVTTSTIILGMLRDGPCATTDLIAATGASRNAILCCVWGLNRRGCLIVNEVPHGGRHDGRFRLLYEAERPTERGCAVPGCRTTVLNRYNRGPYCLAHRRDLAMIALACLVAHDARLPGEMWELEAREAANTLALRQPPPLERVLKVSRRSVRLFH